MEFLRKLFCRDTRATATEDREGPQPTFTRPRMDVGWITDPGRVRDHNEDSALVITAGHDTHQAHPPFGLLVLADGMGGHRAGEVASSMAARVAAHHITHQSYLPSLLGPERDARHPALTEVLIDAVQAANQMVSEEVPGSGTTLTCALVLGTQAYIAHVGDSRAYAITEEGIEQITHDHSVVDRLVDTGQLTPEEAAVHPQKNVLYRAIGQSGALEVDTHVRKFDEGDYLLLCSDGLWGLVSEATVVDLIRGEDSLQEACRRMVAAANDAGGSDNITAVLWRSPLG